MTTNSESQGLSFGQAAGHYDSIRPTYPVDAVRWALGDLSGDATVVDLGAGTGKLTRIIRDATPATVTPVEPDALMRAKLAEAMPGIVPVEGTGEKIPFPDGSVDAVLAGQAYHWFDNPAAHAEIARVVRPGGVLAPIWNVRDESVPWVAAYHEYVDAQEGRTRSDSAERGNRTPGIGAEFGSFELKRFRHTVPMDCDRLVALARSRSFYLSATPEFQARLVAGVRDLAASLPERFDMPYITYCYRAVRQA
jgi:SAM-dependent methyltransferase